MDLSSINGETWSFTVHKYGDINDGNCDNVGEMFKPFKSYGTPPPESMISDVTIADNADSMPFTFSQDTYLLRLGDIVGNSIVATVDRGTVDAPMIVTLGCCVIGKAAAPEVEEDPADDEGGDI